MGLQISQANPTQNYNAFLLQKIFKEKFNKAQNNGFQICVSSFQEMDEAFWALEAAERKFQPSDHTAILGVDLKLKNACIQMLRLKHF